MLTVPLVCLFVGGWRWLARQPVLCHRLAMTLKVLRQCRRRYRCCLRSDRRSLNILLNEPFRVSSVVFCRIGDRLSNIVTSSCEMTACDYRIGWCDHSNGHYLWLTSSDNGPAAVSMETFRDFRHICFIDWILLLDLLRVATMNYLRQQGICCLCDTVIVTKAYHGFCDICFLLIAAKSHRFFSHCY